MLKISSTLWWICKKGLNLSRMCEEKEHIVMWMICRDDGVGKEWILKHSSFQNFEMNPFILFFSVTPLPTVSVHTVILSTIMLLKDNHIFLLFLFLFFCSFLFFFVLFLVAMQFLMAFLNFFFFFNLKHSRIYMKLESKRDPLKRTNNTNNKIDIHRYLYFSTYLRVINK